MAYLVHPLPPRKVWVKKEYLYDLEKGHGELTPGLWISVRSIQAKALYFETLLTDYGALFEQDYRNTVGGRKKNFLLYLFLKIELILIG